MDESWIDEDVESYFAASPIAPHIELGRVAQDKDHPLFNQLHKSFDRVQSSHLKRVLSDDNFKGLYGKDYQDEKEWYAREWIIVEELNRRIRQRRRKYLLYQNVDRRPVPYDEPELTDLEVSTDGLVPLSSFDVEEGVLLRKGRAYTIILITLSENSSYWITRALVAGGLQAKAWVRLDPLIRGQSKTFPRMAYKMLWYGPPLLWRDVENIDRESFGRWVPAPLGTRSEFTDYAWMRRGEETHLFLEEMPQRKDICMAGSRYFHVIFSRKAKCVVHLDGAIRIYSENEWDQRRNDHVHRSGKIGIRIKVFRIDGPIHPDVVSSLGGTFFVWNYDVSNFFGASVPSSLLGHNG